MYFVWYRVYELVRVCTLYYRIFVSVLGIEIVGSNEVGSRCAEVVNMDISYIGERV